MKRGNILILFLAFLVTSLSSFAGESVREERINIRKGNKVYQQEDYAEAEVVYRKALEANPESKEAAFNLATALLRQSSADGMAKQEDSAVGEATQIFQALASSVSVDDDPLLLADVFYDLGNIAFNQQNYDESIKQYKNSLRINPMDDDTRRNLRLAQLKKQEQEEQEQDQDENEQEQNQEQDQDQENENQQDQDQNQDQQNQDQQEQNQDQDQQQQNQQQEQQQQQSESGMSSENIDQILKTMQNQEKDTQQKVNAQKMKEQESARRTINNQW